MSSNYAASRSTCADVEMAFFERELVVSSRSDTEIHVPGTSGRRRSRRTAAPGRRASPPRRRPPAPTPASPPGCPGAAADTGWSSAQVGWPPAKYPRRPAATVIDARVRASSGSSCAFLHCSSADRLRRSLEFTLDPKRHCQHGTGIDPFRAQASAPAPTCQAGVRHPGVTGFPRCRA